jgi:hypothetical protein
MSEEINEIEENDSVEMGHSHSELEHSHSELEHSDYGMTDAEFEAKLTDFFTKHKEKKLKFVPLIVKTFRGHEAEVLEHLHNKYVLGLVTVKSKKKVGQKAEGHDDLTKKLESGHGGKHGSKEDAKPKSKKKLVIIIILIVVLAGLGVTGFMMKDKLFGKGKEHGTEQAGEKGEGEKKAEAPESKGKETPKAVTNDSTKAVANDSAKTAATNAPAKPAADSAKKN